MYPGMLLRMLPYLSRVYIRKDIHFGIGLSYNERFYRKRMKEIRLHDYRHISQVQKYLNDHP